MNLRVKLIVSAVGFIAALIAIIEFIDPWNTDSIDILLTPRSETIVVSSSTLKNNQPIVGDEVVVGERLVTDDAIYIVANHLLFGESGSLKASEIVIFATRITGGIWTYPVRTPNCPVLQEPLAGQYSWRLHALMARAWTRREGMVPMEPKEMMAGTEEMVSVDLEFWVSG